MVEKLVASDSVILDSESAKDSTSKSISNGKSVSNGKSISNGKAVQKRSGSPQRDEGPWKKAKSIYGHYLVVIQLNFQTCKFGISI